MTKVELPLHYLGKSEQIATIGLTGRKQRIHDPIHHGSPRIAWGFTIISGKRTQLKAIWAGNHRVILYTPGGKKLVVRISAYPSSTNGIGWLELV